MSKNQLPTALVEATGRLLPFQNDPLRAAFLARGIDALAQVAEHLDLNELGKAVASSSNAATLVTALTQPSAIGIFFAADPLMPARLRGLKVRDTLLAAEEGTLSAEDVSAVLHMSRQAVDKRRASGKLLAVEIGKRGYRYPAWQIADDGSVLPGMEEILALLADHPPFAKIRFFLSGNFRLDGERPLDRLRQGDIEPVRRAARTFGEHGAA